MSLKDDTLIGFSWDLLGKILISGISFLTTIVLSRILLPEDFGLLAMVNVIVVVANIFIDFGFNTSLVQKKDIKDEHYSSVFIFNMLVAIFMSVILFFSSGIISRFYNNNLIEDITRVMSFVFILNALGGILRTKLYKELDFKTLSIGSILGGLLGGVIGILMAINGFGIWSLVAQTLSTSLINSIYLFFKSRWIPKIVFKIKYLKELWGFSFRIFISTLIGSIYSQLDNLIIGKLFSPASLGYYYRAKSMENFMYEFSSKSLLIVMFPVMSSINDDKVKFKKIVLKSFHVVSFFSLSLLGLLYLIADDLIIGLLSEKWIPSVNFFKLLLLSSFAYPIGQLTSSVLASSGNSKAFLNLTIVRYLLLTPAYGFLYFYSITVFLYSFIIINFITLFFYIKFMSRQINSPSIWFYKALFPYVVINLLLTIIFNSSLNLSSLDILLRISITSILFIGSNLIFFYFARSEGLLLLWMQLKKKIN